MSQHYLKYHFKSFINNINNKATRGEEDEENGNNGNGVETDTMNNGNLTGGIKFNPTAGVIRITENPLPENVSC